MQHQPKTIQFNTPEQLELCQKLAETSKAADKLKSEAQAKLKRDLLLLDGEATNIKSQLADSVKMSMPEFEKYTLDLMYLEPHNLAFAYERPESNLPMGLQAMLGIGQDDDDALDAGDIPTAH